MNLAVLWGRDWRACGFRKTMLTCVYGSSQGKILNGAITNDIYTVEMHSFYLATSIA